MKSRGTSCAVYHDVNKGQLNFAARYYTPGQTVSRAYGVYTVASGSWVLYFHKKDGSISEIPRGPNLAWLAPMVKDEDGQLVETPLKECQTLYYSTCAASCCAPFRAVTHGAGAAVQRQGILRRCLLVLFCCSCQLHELLAARRDPRVASWQLSIEYAPRMSRGSGVFFAFQLVWPSWSLMVVGLVT